MAGSGTQTATATSLSPRTVQQALTHWHQQGHAIPSPGTITGVWNTASRVALQAALVGSGVSFEMYSGMSSATGAGDGLSRLVRLTGAQAGEMAQELRRAAGAYQSIPAGVTPEPVTDPRTPTPQRRRQVPQTTPAGITTIDPDVAALGADAGMSTLTKVLIGAGVATLVAGIGIYIWRARR